jgi:hypothetical protein
MDVAIYLLDNGAALDEVVSSEQKTPLLVAATYHEIDILRMLLNRGASLDHFDAYGSNAAANCIFDVNDDNQHRAATVDMLKVISEFGPLDTDTTGSKDALLLAAMFSGAREIDFLVSLGCKDDDRFDSDHSAAIDYAAKRGNSATYFALLAHGATTERPEHELLSIVGSQAGQFVGNISLPRGSTVRDPIIEDLLSRRADLMTSICIVDGWPRKTQGPAIPLQQAVAGYGPEVEAWFLGLLQECGRETEEDQCRLQELRMGGYGQYGMVIGEVQEELDDDKSNGDVGEQGQSSAENKADDTEDDECFWDAEEGE